jgi:hypothetical protein
MPASTCTTPGSIVIAALYKFVRLEDPAAASRTDAGEAVLRTRA